jgi:hypothetical protein
VFSLPQGTILRSAYGQVYPAGYLDGENHDPVTLLHKYLYPHSDPVTNIDLSGCFSLPGLSTGTNISSTLAAVSTRTYAKQFSKALWGEVKIDGN